MQDAVDTSFATWEAALIIRTLRSLDASPRELLDFGCGQGALVRAFRAFGIEADGVDFPGVSGPDVSTIETPYRLPFPDASFDAVVSTAVFEHVMDYPQAITEIARVLRPGGITLHLIPAKWSLLEPHMAIPFGGVIGWRWWRYLWSWVGVAHRSTPAGWREVYKRSNVFLEEECNYLERDEILRSFREAFPTARFAEQEMYRARGGVLMRAMVIPGLSQLLGIVKTTVVVGWKRSKIGSPQEELR